MGTLALNAQLVESHRPFRNKNLPKSQLYQNVCHHQNCRNQLLLICHRTMAKTSLISILGTARWRCHRRSSRIRSWYWFSIRIPHHWLRKKPISQTTTFLIRHFGFRFVCSYGSLLSYDGLLTPLRFLSDIELWLTMIYINEFVVPSVS